MKTHLEIPVVAIIERDALFGALACLTFAELADWTPEDAKPKPWGEAARAICALLKVSGVSEQESKDELVRRLGKLQDAALAELAA